MFVLVLFLQIKVAKSPVVRAALRIHSSDQTSTIKTTALILHLYLYIFY